jgi:hypothetical protein
MQQQQTPHWKDRALEQSVVITDAWEVTKTYAGRIAEWVLFLCMIANIIEMLPGISMAPLITNIVLGTQVIMLDVGGFSLASMADHARMNGDEQAARHAEQTGRFLIGIMIVTLLLVAIGLLFPVAKPYTDLAEKGLILVRVVMTVVYGHVIHSLRRVTATAKTTPPATPDATPLDYEALARQVASLLPAPPVPTLDYQQIAQALVPLLTNLMTRQGNVPATPDATDHATENLTQKDDATMRQPDDRGQPATPDATGVCDSESDTQDNYTRVVAYALQYPDAKPKAFAEALGLSVRTVQRHLTRQTTEQRHPAFKVVRS